ncbi:hypothetical protein LCGC14_2836200, partial [marine sediment metagenome]
GGLNDGRTAGIRDMQGLWQEDEACHRTLPVFRGSAPAGRSEVGRMCVSDSYMHEAQVGAALTWTRARPRPGRVEAVELSAGRALQGGQVLARSTDWLVEGAASAIICAEGTPWPCEWAIAVVRCESSGRADAWATEIVRGVRYWFHGWFQIVSTSPDPGPLADPVYNTERAAWKYINEGMGAWPGCP